MTIEESNQPAALLRASKIDMRDDSVKGAAERLAELNGLTPQQNYAMMMFLSLPYISQAMRDGIISFTRDKSMIVCTAKGSKLLGKVPKCHDALLDQGIRIDILTSPQ